jgi:succinyl-CoA synthetase beta subunit
MHHTSMLLAEARGKALLREWRIAVPEGREIRRREDLDGLRIEFPVAVKAQVTDGGRGLRGGVVRCESPVDLAAAFDAVTAISFNGSYARSVLVERWLDVARELYLAITVDATTGGLVALYSPHGGIDVERGTPARYEIGLPHDFRAYAMRRALEEVEPDYAVREKVVSVARSLVGLAEARSCTTVEINPLVVLSDGTIVAADAKLIVDEAARFRSDWIGSLVDESISEQPPDVRRCLELGMAVVWMNGDVGLISSGAGMTMAAMDALDAAGASAACFLDVSGNPTPAGFAAALELARNAPQVRSVLVSIFGGGMHVDRVARTLLTLLHERVLSKPIILRLGGTGANAASDLLMEAGYHNHDTLEAAIEDIRAAADIESVR